MLIPLRYEDGVFKPGKNVDLPPGTRVRLDIAISPSQEHTQEQSQEQPKPTVATPTPGGGGIARLQARLAAPLGQRGILALLRYGDVLLLLLTTLAYALTRFIGLEDFPIYFFCDEAIQPVLAQELTRNGFRGSDGLLFPTYFLNADKWSLSLSVYIHLISVVLFGKSVFVTRATSVVVGILAPVAVALTLKLVFKVRSWWIAPLVLAAIPAWFIHSRTAFETAMMVAFYACFLCTYLLYRVHSPRYLVAAVVFGATTFYSYTNGQGVMFVSGILLLFSDFPYHIRQIRHNHHLVAAAVFFVVLLAVPFIRFRLSHPGATSAHLGQVLDSYWFQPDPLSERLATFFEKYLQGLDPRFWFGDDSSDPERFRHRFKGMGHLPMIIAPFLAAGLAQCVWRFRSPPHRTILVAILAAPFASALAWIAVYRALAMVIPATLLAVLGFDMLLALVARWRRAFLAVAGGATVILLLFNGFMVSTALTAGPTWYKDYGLTGTQYGARQIFGEAIPDVLATEEPKNTRINVSTSWANNPGIFIPFFLEPRQRQQIRLVKIENYLTSKQNMIPNEIFVLPANEYEELDASEKLILQPPERIVPYPNGEPGFYFVRMRYADTIDELFAADEEERNRVVETTVTLEGEPLTLRHSLIDMGNPQNIFDGDTETLMRGKAANPFVMEFVFPEPRTIATLALQVRAKRFTLTLTGTPAEGEETYSYTQNYEGLPLDPRIEYTFPDGPLTLEQLRVEIYNPRDGITSHIHVWEVEFE